MVVANCIFYSSYTYRRKIIFICGVYEQSSDRWFNDGKWYTSLVGYQRLKALETFGNWLKPVSHLVYLNICIK